MSKSIQLVTESLMRESLISTLVSNGYEVKGSDFQANYSIVELGCIADVLVLQAHLWPRIKDRAPDSSSIFLLGIPSWFHCWFEVMSTRVSAYVTPHDLPDTITTALEWLLEGEHYLSTTMRKLLNCKIQIRQEQLLDTALARHLTQSELEVLVLIGEGYITSEIAGKRCRSVHTIKTQRKNIRRKLDITHGERLAVFAGRKMYALKTLYLMEKNIEVLKGVCENTS